MHKFEGRYVITVKTLVKDGTDDEMLQEAFDLLPQQALDEIHTILEAHGYIAREYELLIGDKGKADNSFVSFYKSNVEKAKRDVTSVYNKANRKIFTHRIE